MKYAFLTGSYADRQETGVCRVSFDPAAGFAIAAFTGFMRLYNDRHWTGDVLAGAAVGIISADISFWLNNLIERKLWNR